MYCYAHFPLSKGLIGISIIVIFIFKEFLKHKMLIVFKGISPNFPCLLREVNCLICKMFLFSNHMLQSISKKIS